MTAIQNQDIRTLLQASSGPIWSRLSDLFGPEPERLEERYRVYSALLTDFERLYGSSERITLVRAPARINLKGVHIDHRGGHLNYMAIDREIVLAVSPRNDDLVTLHDQEESKFAPRQFSIGAELAPNSRGNWLTYIDQVRLTTGDWSNYIRAAVLRLQDYYADRPLKGMNLLISGNIPMAAGLSSSSALVVAAVEAALWVNGLSLPDERKALLCGEAEWLVGTRGGAGDHAAMIFGRRGHVVRLQFFPLTSEAIPFPPGYRVVVCDSLRKAHKADGAKSAFNERIATYEFALLLVKRLFPELAPRLAYLRDLNTKQPDIDLKTVYQILAALPERITREALRRALPDQIDTLERLFRTHQEPPTGYRVRGVCLFGLAECERSRLYGDFLQHEDMATVGELMYLSHDGDRVVSFSADGTRKPWTNETSDTYLAGLIADVAANDSNRRVQAELWRQPGAYGCSCEELDRIVDIARTVPGVVGANLTGAGLGGCVVALVHETEVTGLIDELANRYYGPLGLEPSTMVCSSVHGAGRIV